MKNKYSGLCLDLMQKMLVKNPVERIDITAAYAHPWLQNVNVENLRSDWQDVIGNI